MIEELGGVIFYVIALANHHNIDMNYETPERTLIHSMTDETLLIPSRNNKVVQKTVLRVGFQASRQFTHVRPLMLNQGPWPKWNNFNINMLANTKYNIIDFLCFKLNIKFIKNSEDKYLLFKRLGSFKEIWKLRYTAVAAL